MNLQVLTLLADVRSEVATGQYVNSAGRIQARSIPVLCHVHSYQMCC